MGTLVRLFGCRGMSTVSGSCVSRSTVTRAVPGKFEVLAMSTYVCALKSPPSSPPAVTHSTPVSVAPGELVASVQSLGQYIERSATIGTSESTTVDIAALASWGSSPCTLYVARLFGATSCCTGTTVPYVSRYEMVTCAVCVGSGFASSRNVSKKLPVAPSAKNQCALAAVTPALSWPPRNASPSVLKYIARSTMMGTPLRDRMLAETSVSERPGSLSTQIVRRECAATA